MEIQNAGITPDQIKTLSDAGIIPAGTPPAQVSVFAEACRQHGLSPFRKEIYLVKYNTKNGSQYHTIVGIDGLQQRAASTGRFAGVDEEKYNQKSDGTYLTAHELKNTGQMPDTCTVTVYAMINGIRCPFSATVVFAEYYPSLATGRDNYSKAATMPFNMIAKCARAKALKMAFSDVLSGLHIEEEKAAFEDTTISAKPAQVDVEVLKDSISKANTRAALGFLYKSNPAYKEYADLFSERAKQIEA